MGDLLQYIVWIREWWRTNGLETPCEKCKYSQHKYDEWIVVKLDGPWAQFECIGCKTRTDVPSDGCLWLLIRIFEVHGMTDLKASLKLYEKYYAIELQQKIREGQLKTNVLLEQLLKESPS